MGVNTLAEELLLQARRQALGKLAKLKKGGDGERPRGGQKQSKDRVVTSADRRAGEGSAVS